MSKHRAEITSSSEKISVSDKSSQELPAFSEEEGSRSIRCCGWGELSRACKYENKMHQDNCNMNSQHIIVCKWYIKDVRKKSRRNQQSKKQNKV